MCCLICHADIDFRGWVSSLSKILAWSNLSQSCALSQCLWNVQLWLRGVTVLWKEDTRRAVLEPLTSLNLSSPIQAEQQHQPAQNLFLISFSALCFQQLSPFSVLGGSGFVLGELWTSSLEEWGGHNYWELLGREILDIHQTLSSSWTRTLLNWYL